MGQVMAWRPASAGPTPVASLPAAFRAAGRGGVDGPGILAVLDGMDTAVLAVRTGDDAVLANAAARALFGLPAQRRVTVEELVEHARVEGLATGAPLQVDDLPVVRALSGAEVGLEVRVVPRSAGGRGTGHGAGVSRRASDGHPDGGRRLLLRARPLFGPGAEVVGAVCTAQDLTDLHTRHAVLARRARELAAINEATRAVLRHEDARRAVCDAARRITRASCARLFEPDPHGEPVCTVQLGEPPPGPRLPEAGPSVVATVFETGALHVMTPDTPGSGPAAIWQPVLSHGACRAVLALSFPFGTDVADQVPVVELLAAEASMAIERHELLRQLRREASSDGLTGASNRRAWEEELPRALGQARRTGAALSLVMLDLDHFKEYNDTLGHPAGDELLRATVAAWRQRLRGDDLLFRYGGEEFVVLLRGCGPAEAMVVAEQLRAVVPDGQTCSAGVAGWDGAESPQELLQRVDEALYRAKQAGRDRAVASR